MKGKRWLAIVLSTVLSLSTVASVFASPTGNEVQTNAAETADEQAMEPTPADDVIDQVTPAVADELEENTEDAAVEEDAVTEEDAEISDIPPVEETPEVVTEPVEETGVPEERAAIGSVVEPSAAVLDGWVKDAEGYWYYYREDRKVYGDWVIDSGLYSFEIRSGRLSTGGLSRRSNGTYYFSETGATPQEGLGRAAVGWKEIQGKMYYFSNAQEALGKMYVGWNVIGGKTFYFEESLLPSYGLPQGYMCTGWKVINGKSYYFRQGGATGVKGEIFKGWHKIGSRSFYFKQTGGNGEKGRMFTGWQTIGTRTYYFRQAGANGVKGEVFTGWHKIGSKSFYFKQNGGNGEKGRMFTGWQVLGKKTFYFRLAGGTGETGRLLTGWQKVGSQTFYFKQTGGLGNQGSMYIGWLKLSGKWFYFKQAGSAGTKGRVFTGWLTVGGKTYYLQPTGAVGTRGKMLTGWQLISKKWYLFDQTSGAMKKNCWIHENNKWYFLNKDGVMLTGWGYVGGLKYYFDSSGAMDQDLRDKFSGPYMATVSRTNNVVTIYAKDGNNGYIIPIKAFTCSVGMPSTPTPTGTYNTLAKYRWKELMGPSYGQYATRIVGGILFHSVAGYAARIDNLNPVEYNRLGSAASHGCVRLCVRDAKWIYDNCQLGMQVKISDAPYQPFDKPATLKMSPGQNVDPTDPAR